MSSKDRVYLFDTALRDGAQTQGVDFTVADKAAVMRALCAQLRRRSNDKRKR
jgi:2-isopropylmalate synthase